MHAWKERFGESECVHRNGCGDGDGSDAEHLNDPRIQSSSAFSWLRK